MLHTCPRISALLVGAALSLLPLSTAWAGDLPAGAAVQIVDKLSGFLDRYVDPAIGARVQAKLKEQRATYGAINDRAALAEVLSRDMVSVSGDLHLKVNVNSSRTDSTAQPTAQEEALLQQRLAHGLMAVRRLPANIGYLKLRYFGSDSDAVAMIDAALGLLKDTDALIIDLRENTGGGGSDARLLGHLSARPIPMATIHWRQDDGSFRIDQRTVSVPAGGPLYPEKPVFLLTARRTFSAAEEFAYDLKAAQRATLVGEVTRGGGNPSNRPADLGYGMGAFIPNGKVVHPTTGTGWEGKGVAPDVAVPPDQALTEAYGLALAVSRPLVSTPKSEKERTDAIANPHGALLADQLL